MGRSPFRLFFAAAGVAAVTVALALPVPASAGGWRAAGVAQFPSAAQLDAVVAELNRRAGSVPASVTGWHVDPAARSVVVSVLGSDPAAAAWVAGAGRGSVRLQRVTEVPRLYWNIIGGQPLTGSSSGRCSIGLNARSATARYVISSGHCVTVGRQYYGPGGLIGTGVASGPAFGLIRVDSAAAQSTALVSRHGSGGNVIVVGSANAGIGAAVCRSGSTTGWRCGTLQARGATVCYPGGCVYNLIRTNVCGEPGDSGGPLVTAGGSGARVQAQGILLGGSGNCSSGGTTYFAPINDALNAWGLTLYTGV